MIDDPVVVVSATRTPMGGFQGVFADVSAPELGASVIKAVVERAGLDPSVIDEVMMGHVLPAGVGQAPTRQATLGAGLSQSTQCTGISKVCGSGMKAVITAHDVLLSGSHKVMVAGGMESMSNAPYLLDKARSGYRLGHGKAMDHMFLDGLEDAYFDRGKLMGVFAEQCASHYNFGREEQDAFAIQSLQRAVNAIDRGLFVEEITPYLVKSRKGECLIENDEQPPKANPERIPSLRPAFDKNGTVTAANASSISDGAAALLLMRISEAEKRGLTPLAKLSGHAAHSGEPCWFTTAPVQAMKKLADKMGKEVSDFDLYEVNEAFAVVTMAATQELGLDPERVNINGGACALGHPIGASGSRIIVTLLHALQKNGLKTGMASLCIGGGEATAIAVEMI